MPQRLTAADVAAIFPEMAEFGDAVLREKVAAIWCEIAAEMPWSDINAVPKNNRSARSLVNHIRGVTQTALHICEVARRMQGKRYDKDLLLAACLLHDASKPIESEPAPGAQAVDGVLPARPSALGRNLQHAVFAAHKILEKGLPLELANLVITHTHATRMRGKTWEAAALFYADYADTDAELSATGKTLYTERWNLNDAPAAPKN